jgi:acetamidase/formamidase
MPNLRAKKGFVTAFAVLALVLAVVLYAVAQQATEPKKPAAGTKPAAGAEAGPKRHKLAATLETVQWGWLDPKEPPKLTIDSGDIVSIETMMHAHNKVRPGITMDEIVALRKANPGGGPHSVTGPIYVNGAEPGDVMEIRILRIVPRSFAINFNLPGKDFPTIGALASEMPDGFIKFFALDVAKRRTEFKPGVSIELQPFPGTLAVGIDPNDPAPRKGGSTDPMASVSTLRPWKNGSNMDLNELQAGSTVYVPVFLKGGLIWTGDSHCRQGNGEVNLTAIECSFREIVLQPIVRKDMKFEWPRAETKTHWILMGFDEDLNKAMVNATRETVDFLSTQKMVPMDRYEAYSLASIVADCRVTQVVDVRKGVHCMVPKSIFTKTSLLDARGPRRGPDPRGCRSDLGRRPPSGGHDLHGSQGPRRGRRW